MKSLYCIIPAILSIGCGSECGSFMSDGKSVDGNMCQERITRTITVSDKFTLSQVRSMKQAAIWWNEAVPDKVSITFAVVDGNVETDVYLTPLTINILAGANPTSGDFQVNENTIFELSEHELATVVAHELGHSFGLGHSDDPLTLMFPSKHEYSGPAITAKDILHFRNIEENGVY